MSKIILEYSGWVELHPDTKMQYTGDQDRPDITVAEWSKLTQEQQSEYVIEFAHQAIENGIEGEWSELSISVKNDE